MDDEEAFFILNQVEETLEIDSDLFLELDFNNLTTALFLYADVRSQQTGNERKIFSDDAINKLFEVKEELREASK